MTSTQQNHQAQTESTTNWLLVFIIWLIGLSAAMQFAKFSITVDDFVELYSVSESRASFLLSSVGILGIFLGTTAGIIIANLGVRFSLMIALILGAACSLFQALMPSFNLMLFSRVIEGISHLLIVVAAPSAMIAISALKHKSISMGIWATFFGVAFAIMGYGGSFIIERFDISTLFILHAGFMIVLALLFYRNAGSVQPNPADKQKLTRQVIIDRHIAIYSSLRRMTPSLVFFWHALIFVALITYLPQLSDSEADRKLLASVLPLLTIPTSLLGGYLVQRTQKPLPIIGTASIGIAICAAIVAQSIGTDYFVKASCLMILVAGIVPGASFASIPVFCPLKADQIYAAGAITQMGNIGSVLGPPLFSLFLVSFSTTAVPYLTTALTLLAAIISTFLYFSFRHSKKF